ncbi:MAG: hypothetical protein KDD06_20430, partial [Phaeodactylibacter sp.]|nr:hypothetical protein [Phaeodactylibacter sp.]
GLAHKPETPQTRNQKPRKLFPPPGNFFEKMPVSGDVSVQENTHACATCCKTKHYQSTSRQGHI